MELYIKSFRSYTQLPSMITEKFVHGMQRCVVNSHIIVLVTILVVLTILVAILVVILPIPVVLIRVYGVVILTVLVIRL
jgi:hypothetical protein